MLGVNVFAAESDAEGRRLFSSLQEAFVNLRRGHPGKLPPPDPGFVDRLTPADRRVLDETLCCSVVGSPATVQRGLEAFVARTGADELMLASQIYDHDARLRSYELAAAAPVGAARSGGGPGAEE
jgi:alkanesulfonate monooxygenase SsuD/methylene tetrahydromethanopterin reductase-like flavin-dependent oxidoreductase (luciferase family)